MKVRHAVTNSLVNIFKKSRSGAVRAPHVTFYASVVKPWVQQTSQTLTIWSVGLRHFFFLSFFDLREYPHRLIHFDTNHRRKKSYPSSPPKKRKRTKNRQLAVSQFFKLPINGLYVIVESILAQIQSKSRLRFKISTAYFPTRQKPKKKHVLHDMVRFPKGIV
jgi:hypothetical protein